MSLHPAVRNQRQPVADRASALHERFDLRHAEVRGQPRRATPSRPDADLDAVDPTLQQKARALGGRHIARDQLDRAVSLSKLFDRALHDDRVAVRDVDDQHVGSGTQHLAGSLQIVSGGAHRGRHSQPALLVSGCERMPLMLDEVLRGDEAEHRPVGIDQRQLLDLPLSHDLLGRSERNRAGANDQLLEAGHPVRDPRVASHEPHVAFGHHAHQPTTSIDHDERADARLLHEPHGVGYRTIGSDGARVRDDAVLRPLDRRHFRELRRDVSGTKSSVDDANAPFFRHHRGHRGPRDGVHVG